MPDFTLQTDLTPPHRGRQTKADTQPSEDTGFAQHLYPEQAAGTPQAALHTRVGVVEKDGVDTLDADRRSARRDSHTALWHLPKGIDPTLGSSRETEMAKTDLSASGEVLKDGAQLVALSGNSQDVSLKVGGHPLEADGARVLPLTQGSASLVPQEHRSAAGASGGPDQGVAVEMPQVSETRKIQNAQSETVFRSAESHIPVAPLALRPDTAQGVARLSPAAPALAVLNAFVPEPRKLQSLPDQRSFERVARDRSGNMVPVQGPQPALPGTVAATAPATIGTKPIAQPASALLVPEVPEPWHNAPLRERDAIGLATPHATNQVAHSGSQNFAAPTTPPSPTAQIAQMLAQTKGDVFEITLSPEELGRVRIHLQQSEIGLQVLIATERPETLDFLRKNIAALSRDLSDLGFAGARFEFEQGHQDGQHNGRSSDADLPAQIMPVLGTDVPPSLSPQTQTNGLDLRF
ncbi:hypothetical protein ROE7235_01903 [Roseibaca ekhonensis]|jgi:flagellar hook-length control protein FliK|uniref:Flagellar hook-length control protein-like C-terminal domain-containing protein n=2 Tax=Roseinatronobacter ekhonensis TaxID=254356 RepID=A0A3B0MRA7_9RHOB|nr:hypothetical protein ROE7235_01903 [Roseibaca ekhonensis]